MCIIYVKLMMQLINRVMEQWNAEIGTSDMSYSDGITDLLWLELLGGDALEEGNDQLCTEIENSSRFDFDDCGVLLDPDCSEFGESCAKRIKLDSETTEERIISTSSTVQEHEATFEENIAGPSLCYFLCHIKISTIELHNSAEHVVLAYMYMYRQRTLCICKCT